VIAIDHSLSTTDIVFSTSGVEPFETQVKLLATSLPETIAFCAIVIYTNVKDKTMTRCISIMDNHSQHQVDVVLTPNLTHYAKLVCRECNGAWLQWLSRTDTEALIGPQATKTQKTTQADWSNTQSKERKFYISYQQPSLKLPRTPTQLIRDRLALNGHSRYNGNSIYTIPADYLQALLDTNRITRKEDRQQIQAAIELQKQTGTEPGPPEI
jgi:hypothetical protein